MISVVQKNHLKKNSWICRAWDRRSLALVAVRVPTYLLEVADKLLMLSNRNEGFAPPTGAGSVLTSACTSGTERPAQGSPRGGSVAAGGRPAHCPRPPKAALKLIAILLHL